MSKIAFITGAGKGIGEAIAGTLAGEGIKVAIASRTETDLQHVAEDIHARGGEAFPIVCDVTQPDSIAHVLAQVRAALGDVTILVNNAGQAGSHKFLGHDDALWQRMIDMNLNSVYHVTKQVAPMMVGAGWGRIVNIASVASKVGGKYIAAYTASKHGVLGLTRALAVELVSYNITVNAVCPGYVDTPMTDAGIANIAARARMSEAEARAALERASPSTWAGSASALMAVAASDSPAATGTDRKSVV